MTDKIVVLTTCVSKAEARRIADRLVAEKQAACVSILTTPVESTYRWKGNVESAKEFLLLIKTKKKELAGLRKAIAEMHSYDVPEILALPVTAGSVTYLKWIDESVGPARPREARRGA